MHIKKYRFIHLMIPDDLKFLPRMPQIFNDTENGLDGFEHLFVTPHKHVYNVISEHPNVEFSPVNHTDYASLINKYGKMCDWLFVHGMCSPVNAMKIKDKYLAKIIWRTWGNDAAFLDLYKKKTGQPIKNIAKSIIARSWNKKISKIYAVGVGNNIDVLDIRRRYGDLPAYFLSYANKGTYENLLQIEQKSASKDNILRILLGHSGYPNDNHFEIIDKLCAYRNEAISVYIPLSYGNKSYIEDVKSYAAEKLNGKAVIVDSFMDYCEYASFLNQMDIAVLDGESSYALGNIGILLFFRKKLFLNSNGIIKTAFDNDNIPYCRTDEIGKISFEEFASPISYKHTDDELSLQTHSFEYNLKNWKLILSELKSIER